MSKKVCKDKKELKGKMKGKKKKFYCKKCEAESVKKKWLCKPEVA
ncbi:MAG TPA: hypothetical protein VJ951_01250 [Bacteroidales bacterium]|nr:hypothetical protein [Bacteroidales bacterium]